MTASPTSSPGLSTYRESVTLDFPELVDRLRGLLGAKLVAYLGAVKETRAVRQWAAGERVPGDTVAQRLRLAYQVAGLVAESQNSPAIVQAWFQGANPQLEDRSPARVPLAESVETQSLAAPVALGKQLRAMGLHTAKAAAPVTLAGAGCAGLSVRVSGGFGRDYPVIFPLGDFQEVAQAGRSMWRSLSEALAVAGDPPPPGGTRSHRCSWPRR